MAAPRATAIKWSCTSTPKSCRPMPSRARRRWKTAYTFPRRRFAAWRAMPPPSPCATTWMAPFWTSAARPGPSRRLSAARSRTGTSGAGFPGVTATTAMRTMYATGRTAVRRSSRISSSCADATTGPSTKKDSESSFGMTAPLTSSGPMAGRCPRPRRCRTGVVRHSSRLRLISSRAGLRSTQTRQPLTGTASASTWTGPYWSSIRPHRAFEP